MEPYFRVSNLFKVANWQFFLLILTTVLISFCYKDSHSATIVFSTYLGGRGHEYCSGMDIYQNENKEEVVLTGYTQSLNFPEKVGGVSYPISLDDGFLTKFSEDGSTLLFSTRFGGISHDHGKSVETDDNGYIYLTGFTFSPNFPIQNAFDNSHNGNSDTFITKFSPLGDYIVYSTFFGGSTNYEYVSGLDVDDNYSVTVVGKTNSSDFPLQNPYSNTYNSSSLISVSKFSPDGSNLIFSTYFGGSLEDIVSGVCTDSNSNVYFAGFTESVDFPTINPIDASHNGERDAFVSKLSYYGSSLMYSTYLGGNQDDLIQGIVVDSTSNIYVTGYTYSADFPVFNAYDSTFSSISESDVILSKISPAGSLVYSTFLGSSGRDRGFGISLDSENCVYLTGDTNSNDFPLENPISLYQDGGPDLFVTKFNNQASVIDFSTYIGGTSWDKCSHSSSISSYVNEYLYVAGSSWSDDYVVTNGAYSTLPSLSPNDAVLTKISIYNQAPFVISQIPNQIYQEDSGLNIVVSDLNSVFSDSDSTDLSFSTYVIGEGLISNINTNILEVSTVTDFYGICSIVVIATDEYYANVSDTFQVTINPVNDPPTAFNLLAPVDSDSSLKLLEPIYFSWEPSLDVDNSNLTYNLTIFDENSYTITFTVSDTSFLFGYPLEEMVNYSWFVEAMDGEFIVSSLDTFNFVINGALGITDNEGELPNAFFLSQNYPNPFNPSTVINYQLLTNTLGKLVIFNSLGERVKEFVLSNSENSIVWNGTNELGEKVSSGVYFYRLEAGSFTQTKKMLFLK